MRSASSSGDEMKITHVYAAIFGLLLVGTCAGQSCGTGTPIGANCPTVGQNSVFGPSVPVPNIGVAQGATIQNYSVGPVSQMDPSIANAMTGLSNLSGSGITGNISDVNNITVDTSTSPWTVLQSGSPLAGTASNPVHVWIAGDSTGACNPTNIQPPPPATECTSNISGDSAGHPTTIVTIVQDTPITTATYGGQPIYLYSPAAEPSAEPSDAHEVGHGELGFADAPAGTAPSSTEIPGSSRSSSLHGAARGSCDSHATAESQPRNR